MLRLLPVSLLRIAVLSPLLFMLSACGDQPQTGAEDAAPKADAQGRITLSAAQLKNLGITQAVAKAASVVPITGLPAQITAPLAASTEVTVPYAGVVTQVLVDEGAQVQRGQPMLRLQSRELVTVQAELARARAEAGVAQQQAGRDAVLLKEGLIAQARAQESAARAAIAQASVAQANAQLTQLRPSGRGMPGEFELLAPQTGRVLHRAVKPGQALDALASAFTVVEGDTLDVEFNIPLLLRDAVRPGLLVELPAGASAKVMAVGGDADAGAQGLRVRAQLDAAAALLPGQQLEASLHLPAPVGAVVVPASALLQQGEHHVVYVRQGQAWHGVVVHLLGGDARSAVIVGDGVHAGVNVAASGGNLLKTLAPVE